METKIEALLDEIKEYRVTILDLRSRASSLAKKNMSLEALLEGAQPPENEDVSAAPEPQRPGDLSRETDDKRELEDLRYIAEQRLANLSRLESENSKLRYENEKLSKIVCMQAPQIKRHFYVVWSVANRSPGKSSLL